MKIQSILRSLRSLPLVLLATCILADVGPSCNHPKPPEPRPMGMVLMQKLPS